MAHKSLSARRTALVLAADGAAISAAVFALAIAAALLVAQAVGDREVPVGLQIASGVITWLAGIAGPLLVWRMHRRRITLPAVLGALLGAPVAAAVFFLFVALSTALGWVISPISDAEGAGPLVAGSLVGLAFVVLLIWLAADAARDLRATSPANRTLDVARLLAAASIAVYSVIVVLLALGEAGAEMFEALAFMLVGGVSGAAVVAMADLITRALEPHADEAVAGEASPQSHE